MGALIILMQIAAYILFALAAFVALCGFGIGNFDKAERTLVAIIGLALMSVGYILFVGSARIGG